MSEEVKQEAAVPAGSVTATNLRRKLADALKGVSAGGPPVPVTRHGKVVAAVISGKDYDRLVSFDKLKEGLLSGKFNSVPLVDFKAPDFAGFKAPAPASEQTVEAIGVVTPTETVPAKGGFVTE